MYKDIITYELADGISQDHLLKVAQEVYDTWMRRQQGFIQWEIHEGSDGKYTDIVEWDSKEAAKAAEQNMVNIPNATAWFACYKEGSTSSQNVDIIGTFL